MNPKVLSYAQLIVKYARLNLLAPSLVAGLMDTESGGQPDVVSVAGAVGLLQILSGEVMSGRPSAESLKDPEFNIRYGCSMLESLRAQYGTQAGMLAAYFGAVDAAGHPTTATDATGTNGWQYIKIVEAAGDVYRELDQWADVDYQQYAPNTHQWREVADNLHGVCDDALETGRKLRDMAAQVVAAYPDLAGKIDQIKASAGVGRDLASQMIDLWASR